MDLPASSSGININLSDVIEVIEGDDTNMSVRDKKPYIKIVEQPASKGLRFRYECEGRSAGSIPGVSSTPENKTYPTIEICNYSGRVKVVVSCVTKDSPYKPHPHNLVGRDGCDRGICCVELPIGTRTQSFDHLGIQCVKKKDIEAALHARKDLNVDPFKTGFSHTSSIDLNAVRLCFQAIIERSPGDFRSCLQPVVTDVIFDKKSLCDLTICRLSHCSATVAGGQEVILLCEKVAKEDIAVRMYEEVNGRVVWEGAGDFTPAQVHKQVAITFKTPQYKNLQVEEDVLVNIQLVRPSDSEMSVPLPFKLTPLGSGRPAFWSLRRYKADYQSFSTILTADTKLLAKVDNAANESVTTVPVVDVEPPHPKITVNQAQQQDTNNNLETAKQSTADQQCWQPQTNGDLPELFIPESDQFLSEMSTDVQILQKPLENGQETVEENHNSDTNIYPVQHEGIDSDKLDGTVDMGDSIAQQFEDLIEQVDDFDDMITSDLTEGSLLGSNNEGVYTSFQLAMKNPFDVNDYYTGYEDVVPPRPSAAKPVIRSETDDTDDKEITDDILPPLPPKRIRKSPPSKTLPPLPEGKKLNIFQKLFSSKRKDKDKSRKNSISSVDSKMLVIQQKPANAEETNEPDDVTLTEAEHYALYTSFAPRATASEFDETSFYYSPVEKYSQTVK